MPIAAIPAYLGNDFHEASPGLRFGMYLQLWGINRRSHTLLWTTHDLNHEVRGQNRQEREVKYDNKFAALSDAKKLNENDRNIMRSLVERQRQAFDVSATSEASYRLDALATAPFTTGLGNEHPLENGFAFLNPYGLPYLPGSGVKGVLRQAARELASGDWGDTKGWNESQIYPLMQGEGAARRAVHDEHTKAPVKLSMLDALFGLESDDGGKVHVCGALVFWDVVPQIKGDSLAVEIMTPHQGHYYQQNPAAGSTNPHDSGQPIPISYLTVPPGSGFTFHVVCDLPFLRRIAPTLAENGHWKALLTAAFEHAFQWLGFGAKTAVGYGAMRENPAARAERERQQDLDREKAERQAMEDRRANLSPDDLAWEDHQPDVETFRQQFESAKKDPYKPGSQFDSRRNDFMKTALTWEDTRSRQAAGELLKSTMTKAWGTPSNKDSKQRLKDAVARLCPECP